MVTMKIAAACRRASEAVTSAALEENQREQITVLTSPLHAAINVSNLDAAEEFYGTVLGLPKVERTLKFAGTWYQLGSFQIHLIVAERSYPRPAANEKWGRWPHLACAIADLATVKQRLIQAQVPIQLSASGRAALFVQDPDGNIIELTQVQV